MQNKVCECGNPTSITFKVLHDLASIDNLLIEVQEKVFKKKVEMAEYLGKGEEQWKQNLLFPKMAEQSNLQQTSQIFKRVSETIDLDESQQRPIENNSQSKNKIKVSKKQKGVKLVQSVGIDEKQFVNQNRLEIDLNQDLDEKDDLNFDIELTEQDENNNQLEIDLKDIEKINGKQDSNEVNKLSEKNKNICQICFRKLTTKRSLERHMAGTHNITRQTYLPINGNQILDYLKDDDSIND